MGSQQKTGGRLLGPTDLKQVAIIMSGGQTEVDSVRAINGSRRMHWRSPMNQYRYPMSAVIGLVCSGNDRDQAMRSHLYGHAMPCDLIDHPLTHAILATSF